MNNKNMNPITELDRKAIESIRNRLKGEIPDLMNTDLQLRRWHHAFHGNLDHLTTQLRLYWASRRAMGLDDPDFLTNLHTHPLHVHYTPYLSVCTMQQQHYVDSKSNAIVWVNAMEGVDWKQLVKVIKVGDLSRLYLILHEVLMRMLLQHERDSGKESSVYAIIDAKGVHVTDFMNPWSPQSKYMRYTLDLWHRWFSEQINKVLIINAPGSLSITWPIVKHLVGAHMHKHIHILHSVSQLYEHLSEDSIPVIYGGTRSDESHWGETDTCVNVPKMITHTDYYQPGTVWSDVNIPNPPHPKRVHVKHKHIERIVVNGEVGKRIGYQFWTNNDLQFAVVFEENEDNADCTENHHIINNHNAVKKNHKQETVPNLVYPSLTVETVSLPEEGIIECKKSGRYIFEFNNVQHTWFSVKLDYVIEMV